VDSGIGQSVGRYRLLKRIAIGGMGEVFLASQMGPEGFQKVVVLKRMLPSMASQNEFIKLFLDEARLVAKLAHRNIAQIFDLGIDAEGLFVVMEYVKGPSTRRLLEYMSRNGERIPPALVIEILSQVAEALSYAYSAQNDDGELLHIVHRDVTPENILISISGDVKLIDFGVAKSANQEHATLTGTVKGKLSYMSPEQSLGKPVDGRSDVFSLGIVVCELLTGKNPFGKSDVLRTVMAIQQEAPRLPSATDPALAPFDLLVERMLAKDPAERIPDAAGVYEQLNAIRGQVPPPPKRLGPFITEHFGKEVAALIKSVSDPEAQKALRAGSGLINLITPAPVATPATSPARRAPAPAFDLPMEDFSDAPTTGRVVPHHTREEVAADFADAATPVVQPTQIDTPAPKQVSPFAPTDSATPVRRASSIENYETVLRPELAQTAPRARRPVSRLLVIGGAALVVMVGVGAVLALREPAPAGSAASKAVAPATEKSATPSATLEPVPPPSSAMPEKPQPPHAAEVAPSPPEPSEPRKPVSPPVKTPSLPPTPPKSSLGSMKTSSNRPASARAGNVASGRALLARYRRIKEAWEAQKATKSKADVRVFDAALGGIYGLVKSGSPEDLASAKSSMDDFVNGALQGVEP
jgi:eukaryotic-like serine/threonine-protein kinase